MSADVWCLRCRWLFVPGTDYLLPAHTCVRDDRSAASATVASSGRLGVGRSPHPGAVNAGEIK